ncbi:MAG: tryptophan--tRNA ligase [Christensenellales bacterium]|jgi:tryptophanyl-tRNA synthetase
MTETQGKQRVFSGIQPSGAMTIGNYIGAIRHWVALQQDYDCVYSVVDLHAITVRQEPSLLQANTQSLLAVLLACGLDPDKTVLFVQSHVAAHSELAWILGCSAYLGELYRMTQFKDKSEKGQSGGANSGLLTYPVLMAADILLYRTNYVPVGADQKQHLELSRDLAMRFNNAYGNLFAVPEPLIPEIGGRVMSLQDPLKKMSKSDDENAFIALLDKPEVIERKIRRAVTDSQGVVRYSDDQPGVRNLIDILFAFTGKAPGDIAAEFEGKGYGELKAAAADAVIAALEPLQARYAQYMADKAYLQQVMARGAQRAERLAARTMEKVRRKLGFVPRP